MTQNNITRRLESLERVRVRRLADLTDEQLESRARELATQLGIDLPEPNWWDVSLSQVMGA
jgi:hypothetical protein